jgi:YD repeat-containing protein
MAAEGEEPAKAGSPQEWPHWSYAYDDAGNQTGQTDPNGHTTHFAYDELGRRISRTLTGGENESWTYDDFGRVVTHVDFKGQPTLYTYDDSSQVGDGRALAEYRYNAGRVIDATTMDNSDSDRSSGGSQ